MHHKRNRKPAMSTPFYDLASLVVVPSGYKSGKIYAQKPLTTDGQLTFTRASTATRVNASGLIETVSSGVPRLDYLGSSCPKLQLEPQRTNKCPTSANYGTNIISVSVTRDVVAAPNGVTEADRILDDNSLGEHLFGQNFDSITNGQPYTVSCFFKNDGTNGRAVIRYYGGEWVYAVYNLATGTVAYADANITASIQNYGNGWYRCILTHTAVMDYAPMVTQIGIANSSNSFSYQGASNLGVYFWGFQAEQGAYVSSYIPTTSAAVTRLADAASKTGISSLIGQTEGTVFVDFTINGLANYGTPISVNNGSTSNYIWFTIFSNGNLRVELYDGAVQSAITYAGAVVGGRYKMAFGYKTNDFALYVNGAQIGTDNSGTTFSGTTLSRVDTDLTSAASYSTASESINQALLFKTRLTNAQLAELTTL
jgi:hypothetical protein